MVTDHAKKRESKRDEEAHENSRPDVGYNAFFIRNHVGVSDLPEIPAERCFAHAKNRWGMRELFPAASQFPWVSV